MNGATTLSVRRDLLELRSVALFFGVLIALEGAAAMAFGTSAMERLCGLTAGAAGALANLTGASATVVGAQLSLPARELYVNAECTGIFLLCLYAALVVASPAPLAPKVRGLLLGALAILCANLVRLILVVHISAFDGAVFAFLHDYLFQAGMLLVVLGVWAVWLRGAGGHASP